MLCFFLISTCHLDVQLKLFFQPFRIIFKWRLLPDVGGYGPHARGIGPGGAAIHGMGYGKGGLMSVMVASDIYQSDARAILLLLKLYEV